MVLVSKQKRTHSVHNKRRAGQHHKHTPEYHKTYWPYLPLGIIVGLGMLVNSFWPTLQNVLGYATNMTISGLLQETNTQRASESLGALAVNSQLNQAAQAKAEDMAARNYWSHDTPDGSPPWTFISQAGYSYQAAGENLAYGFENNNATVVAWMNSPGHRANIMNGSYKEVGFGIANVPNYQNTGEQTVVVAMYGDPVVAAAAAPKEVSPAPVVQKTKETPAPATNPAPEVQLTSDVVAAANENTTETAGKETEAKNVARIQLMTDGAAPWSMFAISALAAVAVAIFIVRHGLFWRRAFVKSERFIVHHPFLDIALVSLAVIGFVLTRSAGSIY